MAATRTSLTSAAGPATAPRGAPNKTVTTGPRRPHPGVPVGRHKANTLSLPLHSGRLAACKPSGTPSATPWKRRLKPNVEPEVCPASRPRRHSRARQPYLGRWRAVPTLAPRARLAFRLSSRASRASCLASARTRRRFSRSYMCVLRPVTALSPPSPACAARTRRCCARTRPGAGRRTAPVVCRYPWARQPASAPCLRA
jgi:hypothetical protein